MKDILCKRFSSRPRVAHEISHLITRRGGFFLVFFFLVRIVPGRITKKHDDITFRRRRFRGQLCIIYNTLDGLLH